MDNSMKGKIMTGMIVGAFLFALLAVIGSSWMTGEDEGIEAKYGLSDSTLEGEGISIEVDYGDICDEDDESDACGMDTAGLVGKMGLWIGILMAGTYAAMMILPMVGNDSMDAIPEIGQKIISWGAGGMMLLGAIGWMIMKPSLDAEIDIGLGMSFFMAMFAGLLGLAAPLMDMFVPADGE
ncbi:hypothetical protein OAE50_01145 [Candidatus Poseidoniaceae archaeon]|nr:hypothetical protein [Candidatus Poseidoniaceae archaeon]